MRLPPLLPQIVCTVLILFGLLLFIYSTVLLRRAMLSRHWPSVQGEITASKVTRYSRKRYYWDWEISYRYMVEGKLYTGTRAYFGTNPTIGVARAIVAKFPAQMQTPVYFSRDNPGMSVLLPGPNRFSYSGMLIGPLAWLAALAIWAIRWV